MIGQPFKPGDLICYDWESALVPFLPARGRERHLRDGPLNDAILILDLRFVGPAGTWRAEYRALFPSGEICWTVLADSDYWQIIHRK